jgi:predicted protein tyrosine phosphatase
MKKVLFICSQNRLRSPTAERLFQDNPDLIVHSAGLGPDAVKPVTEEQLEQADIIFVMEELHRSVLAKRYRDAVTGKKVVCLNIPDMFPYMDPELIKLLENRVPPHLAD